MHRRLLAVASALICLLAVFLAWVLCDLHDRSLPQELHPLAVVNVALPDGMGEAEALEQIVERNRELGLGLVKVVPDMEHGTDAQVFIPLPGTVLRGLRVGSPVRRFGTMPDGRITDTTRLSSASSGGQYLVCGRWNDMVRRRLDTWAADTGVQLEHDDDGIAVDLRMLLGQSSFRVAIGSALAMTTVLVLFWLSFKARSRALRVMAGVPAWRIQYDDAVGLLMPMLAVALFVDAVAALGVSVCRGVVFIPYLLRVILLFETLVFACLLAFAIMVSAICWPSARMIVNRRPMPHGLLRTSMLVKAVVFFTVIVAISPSVGAFREASDSAREQSVWKRLRNQASVSVAFGSDRPDLDRKTASLVLAMAHDGKAALSYAFDDGSQNGSPTSDTRVTGIVTRSWLDLVGIDLDAAKGVRPVGVDQFNGQARQVIDQFAIWAKDDTQAGRLQAESHCYLADGVTVPMLKGGSDEMLFPEHATLIVVPNLDGFSDSGFLVPALSSRNIVLSGLSDTRRQADKAGLGTEVSVRYVAEEQILRSQFSAYYAWMQAAAIILLLAAFAIVAFVSAEVRATLRADRNYPLLLGGYAPVRLALPTILAETVLSMTATAIVCGILLIQRDGDASITLSVAIAALIFSACCHRTAVNSGFRAIDDRTL